MDALLRGWRLLLIGAVAFGAASAMMAAAGACSPAVKGTPIGVSTGGAEDTTTREAHPASSVPLAGVAPDFRTSWTRSASHVASEHGQLEADVYADTAPCAESLRGKPLPAEGACRFVEDLRRHDAGVGVYLLQHGDAGVRFAVADARLHTVADDAWKGRDAGAAPALDACARCHADAPHTGVFPVSGR